MGDIVERLRIRAQRQTAAAGITEPHEHIDWMAADEIARLRKENARLLEALKPLIEIKDYPDAVLMQRIRAAAAALKEAKNG